MSHALDDLRSKMVHAARVRFAAYARKDRHTIGPAEAASEAADRAYHAEYARCVSVGNAEDRARAAAHLDENVETLRSMRVPI